jgi:hypothetical protein
MNTSRAIEDNTKGKLRHKSKDESKRKKKSESRGESRRATVCVARAWLEFLPKK